MHDVWDLTSVMLDSGLAPKGMETRKKLMVAILAGLELGIPPFKAIRSLAVINGKVALYGDALMEKVRQSPKCGGVVEEVNGDGDKMVAICRATRKDTGEVIERRFSVEDAKKASLWGKGGPWSSYPFRMLQMRARAFALRDGFADVIGSLPMAEEVEDYAEPAAPKTFNLDAVE